MFEYEAIFLSEDNPYPVINSLILATAEGIKPPVYYLLMHNPEDSLKKVKDVFAAQKKMGSVFLYNERLITKETKQMFVTFSIESEPT